MYSTRLQRTDVLGPSEYEIFGQCGAVNNVESAAGRIVLTPHSFGPFNSMLMMLMIGQGAWRLIASTFFCVLCFSSLFECDHGNSLIPSVC